MSVVTKWQNIDFYESLKKRIRRRNISVISSLYKLSLLPSLPPFLAPSLPLFSLVLHPSHHPSLPVQWKATPPRRNLPNDNRWLLSGLNLCHVYLLSCMFGNLNILQEKKTRKHEKIWVMIYGLGDFRISSWWVAGMYVREADGAGGGWWRSFCWQIISPFLLRGNN